MNIYLFAFDFSGISTLKEGFKITCELLSKLLEMSATPLGPAAAIGSKDWFKEEKAALASCFGF